MKQAEARQRPWFRALVDNGGRIIDTASTYGDAEIVMGDEIATSNLRDKIFIATKVENPDPAEFKRSLSRLKAKKVDLLQLHNVEKLNQSLARFREWKAEGLCRYVGVTSTYHRDFPAIEAVLRREKPDFVQIDYSLDVRDAEKRILPLAADVKAAVLIALPLGHGSLFRAVRGRAIPRLGNRFCWKLGPVLPEISPGRSKSDSGHPGNRRCKTYDRQSRGDAWPLARCNRAGKNDFVRGSAVASVQMIACRILADTHSLTITVAMMTSSISDTCVQ